MNINSVICYSTSISTSGAMAYLRLIAPFRQAGIRLIEGIKYGMIDENAMVDGDIVIIQRDFPKQYKEYKKILNVAKEMGKPLVFEVDDLLLFLPLNHPDRLDHSFTLALLPMWHALIRADLVIVSTYELQNILAPYNRNTIVLPNYLDDNLWSFRQPIQKKDEVLTIGYMGTKSHQPDLEFVAPVLLRLVRRYPHDIRIRFWGIKPPETLAMLPQVEQISFSFETYKEFVAYFQTQSADIFIAPLVDNPFNQCKSPIKFFEYSALGTPGVYSRLPPYEKVIEHQRTGLLAGTLEEWEEYLVELIEDDEKRLKLATQAQADIAEKWLLSSNASHWLNVLQDALDAKRERNITDYTSILDSVHLQQADLFQSLRERIEQLELVVAQVDVQKQTIHELELEVLGYVTSRSWRLTRPFRKISRKCEA